MVLKKMEKQFRKLILFSGKDLAGSNMARILQDGYGFQELRESRWWKDDILLARVGGEVVSLEKFDDFIPEIAVVASRHSSKTGSPCLTTHSPGNFSEANLGGENKKLGIAPAIYLREALVSLNENGANLKGYDISLEATHHGPTLNFPLLFVEVGSTEKEWQDEETCKVVTKTIHDILTKKPRNDINVALGFGGGHYCRKFSKEKVTENFALGHICPKYNLHNLDEFMIEQMISCTEPEPTYALVEKKGLGQEKQRIISLLEKTKLELKLM